MFWRKKEKAPDQRQLDIRELMDWRPIGSKFSYLGTDFVVTGHWRWFLDGPSYPCLQTNYMDSHGVVRQLDFGIAEARAIMTSNSLKIGG